MTDIARNNVITRLGEIITSLCDNGVILLESIHILPLAAHIEMSCYNKTIVHAINKNMIRTWANPEFSNTYCRESMRIMSYLDIQHIDKVGMPKKENVISVAQLLASIDIKNIANMEQKQLLPSQTESIERMIKLRMEQKIEIKSCELDMACSKCGHRKFQLHEVQTRSLDESATLRATCVNCGLSININ